VHREKGIDELKDNSMKLSSLKISQNKKDSRKNKEF
jgi:hypothetical protein